MGKKQQVYNEYEKLYFEYMRLLGTLPSSNKYGVGFYTRHNTKDMLCLIDRLNNNIAFQKKQNVINKWLKTEEGVKWYNEKKNRVREIVKIHNNSREKLKEIIRSLIINVLGDGWEITDFCDTQLTISMVEIEDGNSSPTAKFGHHFELRWSNNIRYDEIGEVDDFCLSFNHGCMGDFKIEENSSRIKLIVGMSKLLTDKSLIEKLTGLIREFYYETERLIEEKWSLYEEMKNPSIIDYKTKQ